MENEKPIEKFWTQDFNAHILAESIRQVSFDMFGEDKNILTSQNYGTVSVIKTQYGGARH